MTDIIYVFRENGTTLCTSHVGDPAWDTPENRRRTFDFITRHAEAERERPRALLIQDLAAETRRADSAESKLRETTGELEKADKAIQFHVRAYDLEQARFRKATALLKRLAVAWTESAPANEAVRDAYAFLSRIPSPPIALPADGEPGRIGGRDVPRPALQPACHQVCHGDCHWGLPDAPAPLDVHIAVGPEAIDEVLAQPAAPELCATCHATPVSPGYYYHYSWCESWRKPAVPTPEDVIRKARQPTAPEPSGFQIRFDGPPGPESGRFVECETLDDKGSSAGTWVQDGDYWLLVIQPPNSAPEPDRHPYAPHHADPRDEPAASQPRYGYPTGRDDLRVDAAPEPSSPYPDTSAAWHWKQRAESAELDAGALRGRLSTYEARLAAVRALCESGMATGSYGERGMYIDRIRALLTLDRRGTRDVVETAIDISKADKRRTWAEAVSCTAKLTVSVMASSKGPGAGAG